MKWGSLAAVQLAAATPLAAQIEPHPVGADPHFQVVDFADGQIVRLTGATGYQLMVELSADEQIRNVAVGDSRAWEVSASKDGNRLFLKPTEPGANTNMTVVTAARTYVFELRALNAEPMNMPYVVLFNYALRRPSETDVGYVDVSAVRRRLSRYRLSGNRALRPSAISDDGYRTYISWPKSVSIPAVYAIGQGGREMLVNGMMNTDDVYVLDGVPALLIFRVDHDVARAERVAVRRRD